MVRNMKLSLIENPKGRYHFVGRVPVCLAYDNPTEEELYRAKFGARFGPKTLTFETKEDAIKRANDEGYTDFDVIS